MNLIRWEPFSELMSLRQAMDRLLEGSFVTPSRAFGGFDITVPVDMYQTENEVVVKTALPGIKPADVEVTITGDTLIIKGENKVEEKVKREDYIYQEHRYGTFRRTVTLPGGLETNKAEANFENGILSLTIPKSEQVKPRSIKIKAKNAIAGSQEEKK